ncbi:MAG TPA: branched-chain amino acid aminotransferase [Vitreimonas sp.]|uniref:branched-chain amino acid aminotransferase n=1 Tax=Vitreimonas sp. TaxID=3069702 RepID=UPI002D4632A2|nr:branched-chain amino acid aminotransferase [Vitreimonas sp.]HYD88100.1 branched-chain amino acid aminotransferase [Vitreimonas sp.]
MLPFDERDGWIWLDGRFTPWRDAKLHVLTHALHYGSGVFEGMRMYDGRIFALEAHTRRLVRSAQLLDFAIPWSEAELNEAAIETCLRNGLHNCYIRPIAWRGAEQLSVSALDTRVHVAIAAWPWPKYFDEDRLRRGIRLCWAKYRRPSADAAPTAAKATGLYVICTISKNVAEREGYDDALMLDSTGAIAEATGANIFFVRDGVLFTPPPSSFLDGITRQTIIALARARGIKVVESRIMPADLGAFTECFVVGTAAEVTPVGQIAEHAFQPGRLTFGLIEAYSALVRSRVSAAAEPAPAILAS